MCYSALVQQYSKALRLTFSVRVDLDAFEDLFKRRKEGFAAKIPWGMENYFTQDPKSPGEKRISKLIHDWNQSEIEKNENEIVTQKKRLADAERSLKTKVTNKAENEKRISTDKISKLKLRLERLQSEKKYESDNRIYPGMYAPLIVYENGEYLVRPFRYLLRPKGQGAEHDRKFNGCYNARRDSLDRVFFWKAVYGRNHGVLVIKSFWENVKRHNFEGRKLKKGEVEENTVLRFDPQDEAPMLVPCIYDHNDEEKFPLDSFALITDEPNPEVAAVGHDRTPVIMKNEYAELWLKTEGKSLADFEIVFEDKRSTYFEHSIAA
jgi:putative SOS response-associated peptidase YedK